FPARRSFGRCRKAVSTRARSRSRRRSGSFARKPACAACRCLPRHRTGSTTTCRRIWSASPSRGAIAARRRNGSPTASRATRARFRSTRRRVATRPNSIYGLGAAQVASALMKEGCDIFFVALLGEGIALRNALGPGPDIFVLNGLPPGSESEALAAGLHPVINSVAQLKAWREAARATARTLAAAIQVDSGMSRLGMPPAEVEALAKDAFDGI